MNNKMDQNKDQHIEVVMFFTKITRNLEINNLKLEIEADYRHAPMRIITSRYKSTYQHVVANDLEHGFKKYRYLLKS